MRLRRQLLLKKHCPAFQMHNPKRSQMKILCLPCWIKGSQQRKKSHMCLRLSLWATWPTPKRQKHEQGSFGLELVTFPGGEAIVCVHAVAVITRVPWKLSLSMVGEVLIKIVSFHTDIVHCPLECSLSNTSNQIDIVAKYNSL